MRCAAWAFHSCDGGTVDFAVAGRPRFIVVVIACTFIKLELRTSFSGPCPAFLKVPISSRARTSPIRSTHAHSRGHYARVAQKVLGTRMTSFIHDSPPEAGRRPLISFLWAQLPCSWLVVLVKVSLRAQPQNSTDSKSSISRNENPHLSPCPFLDQGLVPCAWHAAKCQ